MVVKTRHDIHRPSALVPADYEFVAFECLRQEGDLAGWAEATLDERARITAHMNRTGGTYSDHAHGGNCMICGNANAIYTALFYHALTNSYVRVGQDCTEKLEQRVDFDTFRTGVTNALEARAGKRKAEATLAAAGLIEAWYVFQSCEIPFDYYGAGPFPAPGGNEERTVRDIVGKLVQYGSISEKQQSFLGNLLDRIATRVERAAERAQEEEAAQPAPTGRVDVTGTILTCKAQESDFGSVLKLLVKADTGWKLWVTCPSALAMPVKHGDPIRLRATVTPSAQDPKFAYGKRPILLPS